MRKHSEEERYVKGMQPVRRRAQHAVTQCRSERGGEEV